MYFQHLIFILSIFNLTASALISACNIFVLHSFLKVV